MHYYKKNIGDYHKKAGRLSMLQHGAYTLLIDSCYDREQFPTHEEAIDWTWASSKEEVEAVEFVLRKFFTLEDGKYVQNRVREEIDQYHHKAETNSRIAIEREANRANKSTNRARNVNESITPEHEAPPNQEPRTSNQEPVIKKTSPIASADVTDIFDHWKFVMESPKSILDAKRTALINKSLKLGYSIDAMKSAIDGCRKSPHNMGMNDRGRKYNGIDLIFRDADHIEKFIAENSREKGHGQQHYSFSGSRSGGAGERPRSAVDRVSANAARERAQLAAVAETGRNRPVGADDTSVRAQVDESIRGRDRSGECMGEIVDGDFVRTA